MEQPHPHAGKRIPVTFIRRSIDQLAEVASQLDGFPIGFALGMAAASFLRHCVFHGFAL